MYQSWDIETTATTAETISTDAKVSLNSAISCVTATSPSGVVETGSPTTGRDSGTKGAQIVVNVDHSARPDSERASAPKQVTWSHELDDILLRSLFWFCIYLLHTSSFVIPLWPFHSTVIIIERSGKPYSILGALLGTHIRTQSLA